MQKDIRSEQKIKFFSRIAITGLVIFSLAACTPKSPTPVSHLNSPDSVVCADLGRFPQDLTAYIKPESANTPMISLEAQKESAARTKKLFFSPWQSKNTMKADSAFWAIKGLNWKNGFGENLRPFAEESWKELVSNSNQSAYAQNSRNPTHGITVCDASLRAMPSSAPMFWNPEQAGEGFPFDMFQQSTLWIGTPVVITHYSRDKAWVLVETALVSGWLPVDNVAIVDDEFEKLWQARNSFAVIIKDKTEMKNTAGISHDSYAHTGTLLPCAKENSSDHTDVLFPKLGADRKAEIARAKLQQGQSALWPLPFTPANVAMVGNSMMGQPYGWGGMYSNRDCSALTRDIFLSFGLWLPRNSKNQAAVGEQISLEGLSAANKEKLIKEKGVPFQSLLGLPGHITLYLGTYNGTPVMYHNIWGLRIIDPLSTDSKNPKEGRAVIGKAVVTSLRPGIERPDIASKDGLLDRIRSLNNPAIPK